MKPRAKSTRNKNGRPFLFILTLAVSCGPAQATETIKGNENREEDTDAEILSALGSENGLSEAGFAEDENALFSFSEGPCMGTCPVYTLDVYADGRVRFIGEHYVETLGEVEGSVTDEAVSGLLALLDKYRFHDFPDAIPGDPEDCRSTLVTCHPTIVITLRKDGKAKRVEYYTGCFGFDREADLNAMIADVEKLLEIGKWKGEASSGKADESLHSDAGPFGEN